MTSKDTTKYVATLTLTSENDDGAVNFNLEFSHDRSEIEGEQPIAFQTMDFIYDNGIMPFVAIASQLEAAELMEGTDAVN